VFVCGGFFVLRASGRFVDIPNVGPLAPGIDVHSLSGAKPRHPMSETFLSQYKSMQPSAGKLPLREDIILAELVSHLPTVLLLDLESDWEKDPTKIFCRVAGTGLRDIFGCELSGHPLSETPFKGQLARWHDLVRFAAKDAAGAWGEGVIGGHIPTDGTEETPVLGEYMLLPLSHEGNEVNQMLAYVQIEGLEDGN